MKRLTYTSLIVIILDRITKLLAKSLIKDVVIVKNFFNIAFNINPGGAWSILSGYRELLIFVSCIALLVIYFTFIRGRELSKLNSIVLGMLMGGIIGNLIDRLMYGYVIDFLDFIIFRRHFPTFNLADSAIVISVIILIFIEFKGGKHVRG